MDVHHRLVATAQRRAEKNALKTPSVTLGSGQEQAVCDRTATWSQETVAVFPAATDASDEASDADIDARAIRIMRPARLASKRSRPPSWPSGQDSRPTLTPLSEPQGLRRICHRTATPWAM